MTKRIQRQRTKGWRMPPGTVFVGRPTKWGNPWTVAQAREVGFTGTDAELLEMCANLFRNAMVKRLPAVAPILADIAELRGRDLACWCRLDAPCHADVLIEIANAPIATAAAPDA